jgi:hypothetical protein
MIFAFAIMIFVLFAPAVTAEAEENTASSSTEDFPDRLKLWGGYQYLFGLNAKIRLDGSSTGHGTTFDFDDDLNGDTTDEAFRAGLRWRIAPNHAVGFSFYRINVKGTGGFDQSFQINDTIFQAGGRTKSHLELDLYRFYYSYSFYHSEKVELSLSPGFYIGDLEAEFKGDLTIRPGDASTASRSGKVKESLFAPLPTLGASLEYKILPRLTAVFRTDYFYIKVSDIEGSMAELLIGLEYRLFTHFAIGASYNRLWVDVDYKSGKSNGWGLDAKWNGALAYGALYF